MSETNNYRSLRKSSGIPELDLYEAVFAEARNDLDTLRSVGLIDGWEVAKKWPMVSGVNGITKLKVKGYSRLQEVSDLVEFYRGGLCERLATVWDMTVETDKIVRLLTDKQ